MSIETDRTVVGKPNSQERILVVDDEAPIRDLLRGFLELGSYDIIEAGDGVEALEQLSRSDVDLVITDLMMPTKTGLELLQDMRHGEADIPVIIITGKPSVEAAVECIRTGASDFITKPFDMQEINKRVETILAERRQAKTDKVRGTLVENYSSVQQAPAGYEILRTLGQGSMGTIYLVRRQHDNGERYAMKMLKTMGLEGDHLELALERFRREAESARMVEHPSVVKIHDFGIGRDEPRPYIVMEYLTGKNLKFLIKRSELQLAPRLSILRQLADALQAIHDAGICHRDIKPSNVIVDERFNAKLTDFGIARMPSSDLTMTSSLVGSPAYMAPEMFISARVDHRADLFSFGVVAYELLGGKNPFQGDNIPTLMHEIRHVEPRHLGDVAKKLPPRLCQAVMDLLAKQPKDRPESLKQIIESLDDSIGQ